MHATLNGTNGTATTPAAAEPAQAGPKDPPPPHGWTAESWDVLRRHPASYAARRIHALGSKLLQLLQDFVDNHGPEVDLDIVYPRHPLPSTNLHQLTHARHHFAGLIWPLEMMLDAAGDVIPECPVDAPPVGQEGGAE